MVFLHPTPVGLSLEPEFSLHNTLRGSGFPDPGQGLPPFPSLTSEKVYTLKHKHAESLIDCLGLFDYFDFFFFFKAPISGLVNSEPSWSPLQQEILFPK